MTFAEPHILDLGSDEIPSEVDDVTRNEGPQLLSDEVTTVRTGPESIPWFELACVQASLKLEGETDEPGRQSDDSEVPSWTGGLAGSTREGLRIGPVRVPPLLIAGVVSVLFHSALVSAAIFLMSLGWGYTPPKVEYGWGDGAPELGLRDREGKPDLEPGRPRGLAASSDVSPAEHPAAPSTEEPPPVEPANVPQPEAPAEPIAEPAPTPTPAVPSVPLADATPRFTPSPIPVPPEPPTPIPAPMPEPTPEPAPVAVTAPQTRPAEPVIAAQPSTSEVPPAAGASASAEDAAVHQSAQASGAAAQPEASGTAGGLTVASPTGRDPNGAGGGSTGDGGTAATGRPGSPVGVRGFKPVYPNVSRKRGEQGIVKIEVRVRADGTVADMRVLTDAGYPRLAGAALDAIRKAEFIPAQQNGQNIEDWVIVPFEFTLRGR